MNDKLKILPLEASGDFTEADWDAASQEAAKKMPLKGLKQLPKMAGITAETAKGLKWKSLKWMVTNDSERKILKGFLKHPFKYSWGLLRSWCCDKPYRREGDFFLYGIDTISELEKLLESDGKPLFLIGFSYCHKPFECPSGRFTDKCKRDSTDLVCQQCFIGKALQFVPESESCVLIIPTIHYIGEKIFELIAEHPGREIVFIITACELTLEMFGDWGNMVGIKGAGIRLAGRICNTQKAFELSERGVKPGLTVVLDETQKAMLKLIKLRRKAIAAE